MPGHIKSGHVKKTQILAYKFICFPVFFLGGGGGGGEHPNKMYGIVNFFDLNSYMLQKMVFTNFYLRHPSVLVQIIK